MIKYVNFYDGNFSIITELGSIAELSMIKDLNTYTDEFKGINFEGPVYFFNRIKVKKEGIGEGRLLMQTITKKFDEEKINIINYLNPYGKRDLNSLKRFFRNSGFLEIKSSVIKYYNTLMFRKFKNEL